MQVITVHYIAIRELHEQVATVLKAAHQNGEIVVITDHGKPYGVVLPIRSRAELEDLVLAYHPELQKAWEEARQEIARGDFVTLQELCGLASPSGATGRAPVPEPRSASAAPDSQSPQ